MPNDTSSHVVAESIETAPAKSRNLGINAESGGLGQVGKGSPEAISALGLPQFKSPEEKRQYFKEHMAGAFRYMGGEGRTTVDVSCHPLTSTRLWQGRISRSYLGARSCSRKSFLAESAREALFYHQCERLSAR